MQIPELIVRHLAGTLTEEEQRRLAEWREACPENERTFLRLTDPAFLEAEWRRRKAVGSERAACEMEQRIGRTRPAGPRPFLRRCAAAAAFLLVVSSTLTYIYNKDKSEPDTVATELTAAPLKAGETKAVLTLPGGKEVSLDKETDAAALLAMTKTTEAGTSQKDGTPLVLTVPRGGEFKIELEDGTQVWLNAQSRLTYPEAFSETERRVQVEGEAFFKVAHDTSKPFYVEAHGQVVHVVGTEFNIHAYAEDPTVQTTLVSGRIAMQLQGTEGQEMILTPGHQALYDKKERSFRVKSVDTEVMTSWKDGMFVFEDQNLESIMLTLSRWYDFEYEFTDRQAAATVFMGRIPRYSDFSDVLQIIEMSGGLSLSLGDRKLTISSKK